MDKYRLNTKAEEETKNMVSKRAVLANILMQHAMQLAAVALLTLVRNSILYIVHTSQIDRSIDQHVNSVRTYTQLAGGRGRGATTTAAVTSYLTAARRIGVAVLVFDAYRYAWHRLAHRNRFIYRHLHSWHHHIMVPYAFGAIYGHLLEALISETGGATLATLVSGP